jgi:hypothetical protein
VPETVSEVPDNSKIVSHNVSLVNFLVKEQVGFKKINEQPWGSYQLAISLDSQNWLGFKHVYGWGFLPEEAISDILTLELKKDKIDPNLITVFGEERITTMKSLVI